MIKWTGKYTNGIEIATIEAENARDLMNNLIEKKIIPHYADTEGDLFRNLCDYSKSLSNFASEIEKGEVEYEELDASFDWEVALNEVTEKQLLTAISCCQSNAYYQDIEEI